MSKLIAIEFLSVDGGDARAGGVPRRGPRRRVRTRWLGGAPYAEAIHTTAAAGALGNTTGYLFGRRTYEKMAAYWPTVSADNPMAAHLNATPPSTSSVPR